MVKLDQGLTLGVLLVVIVVMILKPNLLGFLYNNILGKLIFVAAVLFLSLKHTAAGLLAVVFVAIVASMSGYYGFEGFEGEEAFDEDENERKKEGYEAEMQEGYEGEMTEGYEEQQEGYEGEMQEGYEDEQEGLCQGDDCEKEGFEGEYESFMNLVEGAKGGKRKKNKNK